MLYDRTGKRKYLTRAEWRAFIAAADNADPLTRTFCYVLAYTGARVSEVRVLTAASIDIANDCIVFECLKRRRCGIFRPVPVSHSLIAMLDDVHAVSARRSDPLGGASRLWPWCRTTAWYRVKKICRHAGVPEYVGTARAFRHTFGVEGVMHANVPLGTIKRWLGHSRLESTIIYCDAVGDEERELQERMWHLSR